MSPLQDARVVLGVTGSIAAYKAVDLASRLSQLGAVVDTILTPGALEFIRPLTFTAVTRREASTDVRTGWTNEAAGHITLAHEADFLLVAPASANSIARLALGLADDLLGLVALSSAAPLLIAPAMEHGMFHHPATQQHLETLRARGTIVVGPAHGHLASGAEGDGRLATIDEIVGTLRLVAARNGPLAGHRIVVSAGGTREPLDPVRYLGNRSSGMMGFALAQAALDRGAEVHLVAGPTALTPPIGADLTEVETAEEMLGALRSVSLGADVLLMAAAVADFRPAAYSPRKLKKQQGQDVLQLELRRNPDILSAIDAPRLIKIGFAAETDSLERNAQEKRRQKGLALIVANDAETTIGSLESTAILISGDGPPERLPTLSKTRLAETILDRVQHLITDAARSKSC